MARHCDHSPDRNRSDLVRLDLAVDCTWRDYLSDSEETMIFQIGKRYLLMTQRYAFIGTITAVTPTHVVLGDDARILYEDIGAIAEWAINPHMKATKEGSVPGQIISILGTDGTPCPPSR